MKKFDLENVVVAELKKSEIEELKKYLSTLSGDEILKFCLHVFDTEYCLSDDGKMIERFLCDPVFGSARNSIKSDLEEASRREEIIRKKKERKVKMKQILHRNKLDVIIGEKLNNPYEIK